MGSDTHDPWHGTGPSRTAVDSSGNAYVLNRHFNNHGTNYALPASVAKILTDGFIDRNGNGLLDTSKDANNDGTIQPAEMMPLVDTNGNGTVEDAEIQDERIAWVRPVGPAYGLGRAICVGTDGNLWVGLFDAHVYYKISASTGAVLFGPLAIGGATPYGCAIDGNGILYSANISHYISVIETNAVPNPVFRGNYSHGGGNNYGITAHNGKGYVAQFEGPRQYYVFNPSTNTFTPGPAGSAITISVDGSGNVYVGGHTGGTWKYCAVVGPGCSNWFASSPGGTNDTRGTILDAAGDVWRVGLNLSHIVKYNGATGAQMVIKPVGLYPYTYSDASGLTALTETAATGTWTVVQDSGTAATIWDSITWNGSTPAGTSLTGRVRAADVQGNLGLQSFTSTSSGGSLAGITGRYIEVEIKLAGSANDESPILTDVRVLGHPPNAAPTADAGDDMTVTCSAVNCQGTVTLDASASSDPDNDALTYSWSGPFGTVSGQTATVLVPLGTSTITLTVTDPLGETSIDTLQVTAEDLTPPTIVAPSPITVEQTACSGTPASLGAATGTDACGPVTITSNAPATFPVGVTTVTYTAVDGSGNVSTATSTVTVVDTTAPSVGPLTASASVLWPPNHAMVPVTFNWTMTDCDAGTSCSIVSVSSNEPINGLGDGDTAPDWQITGNTVQLRRERSGKGNDRIYTITLQCVDGAGNTTTRTTTVTVPHSQGGRGND